MERVSAREIWFADYNGTYEAESTGFLHGRDLPLGIELESRFADIHGECKCLWDGSASNDDNAYGAYDSFDDKQFPPGSWKKIVLMAWGLENHRMMNRFPAITSVVQEYGAIITSCQIARLAPGSVIRPHCGETNAVVRLHLGISVPEVDLEVCGIRVGQTSLRWENGKCLAFIDAVEHEVWNRSDEYRYILIVDMLLPGFKQFRRVICSRIILTQMVYSTLAAVGLESWSKRIPKWLLKGSSRILIIPVTMVTALHNKLRIFRL